jgi:hypothetical protein
LDWNINDRWPAPFGESRRMSDIHLAILPESEHTNYSALDIPRRELPKESPKNEGGQK